MTSSANVDEAVSSMKNTSGNANAGSSSDGSAFIKSVIEEEPLDEDGFGVDYEAAAAREGDVMDEEEDDVMKTVIKRDDSVWPKPVSMKRYIQSVSGGFHLNIESAQVCQQLRPNWTIVLGTR
jgi:hypothetical protein